MNDYVFWGLFAFATLLVFRAVFRAVRSGWWLQTWSCWLFWAQIGVALFCLVDTARLRLVPARSLPPSFHDFATPEQEIFQRQWFDDDELAGV